MSRVRSSLFLTIGVITCFLIQAQGADKYTDENRPYEFGFTIDGEQHRHEKKDKNGIIQGEFGFITADGVYHVTVYATDEQGRFKIISMKNIRVKPYPTAPTRQGHSLSIPPSPSQSTNAITPAKELTPPNDKSPATSTPPQLKPVSNAAPIKSCSHCSIPTTTTPAPPPPPPSYSNPQDVSFPGARDQSVPSSPNYPGQQSSGPNVGGQQGFETPSQQSNNNVYPQQGISGPTSQQSYPGSPQNYPSQQNNSGQQYNPEENPNNPQQQNYPSQPNNVGPYEGNNVGSPAAGGPYNGPSSQAYPQQGNTEAQNYPPKSEPGITAQDNTGSPQYPGQNNQIQPDSARSPKQFNPNEQPSFPGLDEALRGQSSDENVPPPNQPKLIAAQMQIVDKNTDVRTRRPGETDGLPQGLNKNNMEQLLYTFNYTLGFHGHFEEGYRNGAKQGYYFITGRNGIRTRVDYTADDTGFHPKISQEVFDVSSDEVPKPETEKDEKYGLKGYEFKWLYYPVGS